MGKIFTLASTGHAAAATQTGGSSLTFLLVIVVLFGLFYFVMIRPQRNRQRKVQQMQNEVGPGARIRTTAGMYATVTEVDGDDVVLEVSPGVHMRFMRRAIMDVVPEETADTEDAETAEEAEEANPSAEAESPVEDTVEEPAGAEKAQAGKAGADGGSAAS